MPSEHPTAERRAGRKTRQRSSRPSAEAKRRAGRKRKADRVAAPVVHDVAFDGARMDADAVKVVKRLTRHGHQAYLVGGCVRDLLLDHRPKDFDVATSARPEDVRALFRNSRIIGRRFKLVHVLFGAGKVIETATFRRSPDENADDGALIRSDNAFGEAHEDARRRDFTINALFYDVEKRQVLDWVGGMEDVEARSVKTIGNPIVRFQEDPVRILRAIKFSARLDLGITPDVYDAMVQCRGALAMSARPRLFEELLRLLRGGAGHRSMWLAWEVGVLDVLLPELSAYLADADRSQASVWRLFDELDRYIKAGNPMPDDIVLTAVLLIEPLLEACDGTRDRVGTAFDFLEPVVSRLTIPRRIADAVRRIAAMMARLEAGRPGRFAGTRLYPLAQQVLEFRKAAYGDALPTIETPPKKRRKKKPAAEPATSDEPRKKTTRRRRPATDDD